MVLPGADRDLAEEVMRRAARTAARVCETPDGRPVTMTFGSAELTEGMTIDEALGRADLALVGSKTARRR